MRKIYAAITMAVIAVVMVVGVVNAQGNASLPEGSHGHMGEMHGQMHAGGMHSSHSAEEIEDMREEMKEHMGMTDREFDDMAEHCPMMRGK